MRKINVEIVLKGHSHTPKRSLTAIVLEYLKKVNVKPNMTISSFEEDPGPAFQADVKAVIVEDVPDNEIFNINDYEVVWHVYTLDNNGPIMQVEDGVGDDDGEVNIATHLVLPSAEIYNLWEHLYYDSNVKENLLRYAQTMMEFSDRGVDVNIINCNRVILLHGPPGTGKTSLCKALAQKLTVRMQDRYSSGLLIEINSHSLFSKWFSESGKLVTKMFSKLREIVENSNLLVCVLIDEVESLAHARNQCISGTEPSDSIRVVNAVLTQIDQIKRHSNVLILTTSNITESIDIAFIDRADIKQYLGLPTVSAIYRIYYSCLQELIKVQIINSDIMPDETVPEFIPSFSGNCTNELISVCQKSVGLSGRSLRKIPFIAHALFVTGSSVDLATFLAAMEKAVEREHMERKHFDSTK